MGGFTSFATSAVQLLGAANSIVGFADSLRDVSGRDDYKAQQRQNDLMLQNARENAALQKEQIRLTAEQAETERRAALRRAVARQKAQFGASGVSMDGGSSQAVLLGLFDESEEERAEREALDNLRTVSINQNVAQQQRVNTLQLTQLRERNRLGAIGRSLESAQTIGNSIFS
jgi:hypothetical protein